MGLFLLPLADFIVASVENRNKLLFFFNKIEIKGDLEVFVEKGEKRGKVSIYADSQIMDGVRAEVSRKTLYLDANNSFSIQRRIPFVKLRAERTFPVEILVSVDQVEEIRLLDRSNLTCRGINGESLQIFHAGSGALFAENLEVRKIKLHQTGSGTSILKGQKTLELDLEVEGDGSVDASDLEVKLAKLAHKGAGSVQINSKEWLDARILSSGSVILHQNPEKVVLQQTGSGTMKSLLD